LFCGILYWEKHYMTDLKIVQVDAFTSERYKGNPAAICILEADADAAWMQAVASEMNLSETAYLVPQGDGFGLRWFTPAAEVKLCGHATLAAAHVLYEDGHIPRDAPCRFHTLSGKLIATYENGRIEMDFPADRSRPMDMPAGLAEALGAVPLTIHRSDLNYCLVEVDSEAAVQGTQPDYNALKDLPFHGFVVTAPGDADGIDVVSRFFAPALGVDEDPVTGSAHCLLATYWADKLGCSELQAYQASARGGHVSIALHGGRVTLGGEAVITMRGVLV
jgi:PhzF family phenazine biosynthesis protein